MTTSDVIGSGSCWLFWRGSVVEGWLMMMGCGGPTVAVMREEQTEGGADGGSWAAMLNLGWWR